MFINFTLMKIYKKCKKCDDGGHIKDSKTSNHSCNCAWSIKRTELLGTPLLEVLEYQIKSDDYKKGFVKGFNKGFVAGQSDILKNK